jgi:nicotinamidase-related amidase
VADLALRDNLVLTRDELRAGGFMHTGAACILAEGLIRHYAVKATGRKRLIIGGLHTEICLTFASVQALKDGYDVMYVTDAVGGRSQAAHRTGIERLASRAVRRPSPVTTSCQD